MFAGFQNEINFVGFLNSINKKICKDDINIFKAECHDRTTVNDCCGHFYGVFVPEEKVKLIQDMRSDCDLKELFPSVDQTVIKSVTKGRTNWLACFDVLNSLISSQGGILFVDDMNFNFGELNWPSLKEAVLGNHSQDTEGSHLDCGDWSVIHLHHFDDLKIEDIHIYDANNSMNKLSDDEWDFCHNSPMVEVNGGVSGVVSTGSKMENNDIIKESSTSTTSVLTYRDILLIPQRDNHNKNDIVSATTTNLDILNDIRGNKKKWEPSFQICETSRKRIDREYMLNYRPVMDDYYDNEGVEDVISNELGMKSHAGDVRYRSITMLPPKAMEKKLQRIAAKVTS